MLLAGRKLQQARLEYELFLDEKIDPLETAIVATDIRVLSATAGAPAASRSAEESVSGSEKQKGEL